MNIKTITLGYANQLFEIIISQYEELESEGKTLEEATCIIEEALSTTSYDGYKFELSYNMRDVYNFRKTLHKCTKYFKYFNTPILGELYDEVVKFYEKSASYR